MKSIFTFFLVANCLHLSAQWSNTSNQFYDSLHTPVCTATGEQLKPIVVKSYPDSGYFVVWEDHRRGYYEKFQIFAQKYDKTGKQLWANDGVPISAGTNSQHFAFPSNNDYRNYSVAATDSAGGFYIGYADDSVSTYVWERLTVQHIRNDGTTVFPGIGSVLFTSDQANQHLAPQLIPDGNAGFFISHLHAGYGTMDLYVYCYKDINGTLKSYGGGLVNENGVEISNTGYCGNYPTVVYPQTYVIDYSIYPDMQKGCNVVMEFSQNGNLPNTNNRIKLGFNWLWRVKKDAKTPAANFSKDDVVLFYRFNAQGGSITCKDLINQTIYTYPTSTLISEGYESISDWVYGAERTKGTLIQTDGNINVNALAVNQRDVNGNAVTDWFTRGYYRKQQKFDSIPYEYTVPPYMPGSFIGTNIPGQDKLGYVNATLSDTLLYDAGATYFYDFSLASGGNKIFATGIMNNGARNVLLQQLQVQKITPDSFAVQLNTASKNGILIGREIKTNFSGSNITYNNPQVLVDNHGNGLFYIMEMGRSTRVSPVFNGAELAWGAMGKPTGAGRFNNSWYLDNNSNSDIIIDPINGTGLLTWNDIRTPPSTGNNIYMQHLDNLNVVDYFPPYNFVKPLINPYGATSANPAVFLGTSKKFTTINAHSVYSGYDVTTPVVEILDNYNLGTVEVSVYQNTGAIRKYNGSPYLDRNYMITPENNPAGAATINVRLYFSQTEFDALKTADPSITSPGDLAVIKQPATGSAPASYIFVAGEKTVVPQSWAAVPGGYYIEIVINSFSNFFIAGAKSALPVTWLGIQAQWVNQNEAKVNWQVAQEVNVKEYTVQQSLDGTNFVNTCNVAANNANNYSCTVSPVLNAINYYRVQQTDIDGKSSLSKIVALKSSSNRSIIIYPNPAKNNLFIRNDLNYRNLVITDLAGKVVLKKSISNGLNNIQIDRIPAGSYFIRFSDGDKSETLKFVKE
ncbi:MAG TPA: T9SS type A sorting domain-containing protein [Hanamia sp.]